MKFNANDSPAYVVDRNGQRELKPMQNGPTTEPDLITEVEETPTYRQLFEPCAVDEHSDCIGYSNGLRRDAALVTCSCECHDAERNRP